MSKRLAFLLAVLLTLSPAQAAPTETEPACLIDPAGLVHYDRLEGATKTDLLYFLAIARAHFEEDGVRDADLVLLEILEPLITNEDDDLTWATLEMFRCFGPRAAPLYPALRELARSNRDPLLRVEALQLAYAAEAHSEMLPLLEELLSDESFDVQFCAVTGLASLNRESIPRVLPYFTRWLENPETRPSVLFYLENFVKGGDSPELDSLRASLKIGD